MSIFDEFSRAVVFGDFTKVKNMVENDPEIINRKTKSGYTALHNVMSEEQFDIVEYLISHGADVNIQTKDGIAPLHIACYPRLVDILVENGADVNLKADLGETPLHLKAAEGMKSHDVIVRLLEHGANPDLINTSGWKPIDIAKQRQDDPNVQAIERYMK